MHFILKLLAESEKFSAHRSGVSVINILEPGTLSDTLSVFPRDL